jgi:hypothetical protein
MDLVEKTIDKQSKGKKTKFDVEQVESIIYVIKFLLNEDQFKKNSPIKEALVHRISLAENLLYSGGNADAKRNKPKATQAKPTKQSSPTKEYSFKSKFKF